MPEKDLGDVATEEHEKTPDEAKQEAAVKQYTGYFDRLGQQNKVTLDIAETTLKYVPDLALLVGTMGIGSMLIGAASVLTMGGGFMVGETIGQKKAKKKLDYKKIMRRGVAGTAIAVLMYNMFQGIAKLGNYLGAKTGSVVAEKAAKAALSVTTYPPYIFIDDRIRGVLDKDFKVPKGKEFWQKNWDIFKKLWIFTSANPAFVPLKYQIAGSTGIAIGYAFMVSDQKATNQQEDKLKKGNYETNNMAGPNNTMRN